MKEKAFQYALGNDDIVIVEIRLVNGPKYKDGVMYTFRCMSSVGKTLFAVENSHGKPHMHIFGKKHDVEFDWKAAYGKFDEMLRAHKKKAYQR